MGLYSIKRYLLVAWQVGREKALVKHTQENRPIQCIDWPAQAQIMSVCSVELHLTA